MTKHRLTEWERLALREALTDGIKSSELLGDKGEALRDIIENADYISTSSEHARPEPFHVSYKMDFKNGREYSDGDDYESREAFEEAYASMLEGHGVDLAILNRYYYFTDSDSWPVVEDGELVKRNAA